MSTANLIPETWRLDGDDARDTLARVGRGRLIVDALKRLRFSDGFSHARSMAFLGILLFVEGAIAMIGIASSLASPRVTHAMARDLQAVVPGPAGRILTQAAGQAHQAASSGHWLAIGFGTIAALITGTTMMGQVERAMNRLYGIESDRPTASKYVHAFLLALTGGILAAFALVALGLGGVLANSLGAGGTHTIWAIARWPLGIALLVAAMAVLLKWAPRRHQPAWSWMSFGAIVSVALLVLVTVVLNVFFQYSTTFGSAYGPLAGIIALALWAYATATAFLVGAALAAQLEAVRASAAAPRSVTKTVESEPRLAAVPADSAPPLRKAG
jgi:YihY family inner membrane protein